MHYLEHMPQKPVQYYSMHHIDRSPPHSLGPRSSLCEQSIIDVALGAFLGIHHICSADGLWADIDEDINAYMKIEE